MRFANNINYRYIEMVKMLTSWKSSNKYFFCKFVLLKNPIKSVTPQIYAPNKKTQNKQKQKRNETEIKTRTK